MKLIPLTKGCEAMIDDEDYDMVIQYKWYLQTNGDGQFYAAVTVKGKHHMLHNFLMKPTQEFTVDHIDRNGLNCQRSNMRFATKSQQVVNRRFASSSKFKGIAKNGPGWMAFIQFKGERKWSKTFRTQEQAARAYDKLAKQLHGEFAVLNFPEE